MSGFNELVCYKQIEIDTHGKLRFFLEKHSTKEGTWGKLSLKKGIIDFVFLDGQGKELSSVRMDESHPHLLIPPATWHKIVPVSESFNAHLEFHCIPQRYFTKKYGLNAVHSDLIYVYQTYLHHLQNASILDVGCGSGRNLLYLAKMGHQVSGIDQNLTSLNKIREIAQNESLSGVTTLHQDLNQPLNIESECYDLVLSTVTLQFLEPQRIPDLIQELHYVTKKNGYHFLVFPILAEPYILPDLFSFLPQKEALYHMYQDSGWSILEYKETVGHLHKQDEMGKQISGLFGLLLAQKTG